jgi:hypothetical protein
VQKWFEGLDRTLQVGTQTQQAEVGEEAEGGTDRYFHHGRGGRLGNLAINTEY